MFTSTYGNSKDHKNSAQKRKQGFDRLSNSDQISVNGLEVNVRPLLEQNARLLNGKLIVRRVVNERSFIVFHEEFKDEFLLKGIPHEEQLERWIDLPTHTNIVTCFDQISHDGKMFSLTESTNGGDMFQYIESQNLNLAINVPHQYIETIYDCIIQLAIGMDYAHNNGLVHGQFDLSNVALAKDQDTLIFKVTDFRPATSMSLPLTSEGSLWPFARQKKKGNFTEKEKLEILMLKDIYALGICLLELMIGRICSNRFSISLDSLPLTWAEFAESTPLIQVLVECINIDNITQRKGKLSTIKKLLIKDYLKFFQRPFYKMELPVVGKRTDVCNKKAMIALSNGNEELALQYWEEAIGMKEAHFDTQLNFLIYKWRAAQLSDDEFMAELSKEFFQEKDIGKGLLGIINIATGEKEKGLQILEQIIEEEKKDLSISLKQQRFRASLKEIIQSVTVTDKDSYFQNCKLKSEHQEKIESISINVNSRFLTTTSKDCVNIWQLRPQIQKVLTFPLEEEDPASQTKFATKVLASVDQDCKLLAIYKGKNFVFQTYNIDYKNQIATLKDTIDLQKELMRAQLLDTKLDEFDVIAEIKLINDGKTLKIVQLRKKQPYMIEINLFDCSPQMRKQENKFEDKSIFRYGLTYVQYHESLNVFLNYQLSKGSLFAFPEKEFQVLVVLNREDKQNKAFYVYEVFNERFGRRVKKLENPLKLGQDESDAFDVDLECKTLIYTCGDELVFHSIKIPDQIQRYIRPRFNQALHKDNPAKIAQLRQDFIEKINKNLKNFSLLLPAQEQERRNCLLLMLKKVEYGLNNKRLVACNPQFLRIHKMLMQHQIKECPIVGVKDFVKIGIFDEIKFTNDLHRIKFVSLSSEMENNYMMLAIDGTIYKYDLATKEMLFSFKSQAYQGMMLFDEDTKLMAADTQQLKLWEFIHNKDDAPELYSVLQVPLRVEQAFVNRRGDVNYQIITCKDSFIVYHSKLDKLFDGSIMAYENIRTVEFNANATHFFVGTDKGRIYRYSIDQKAKEGEAVEAEIGQFGVDIIHCTIGIKDRDVFIVYVQGKGVKVVEYNENRIEQVEIDKERLGQVTSIKANPEATFVFIGIPETSSIGVFYLDRITLQLKIQKYITMSFQTFEMDDYCTKIIFMNHKCRVLELYSVKWEYDRSSIDEAFYNKLDDTIIDENDLNYQRQFKGKIDPTQKTLNEMDKKPAANGKPKSSSCNIF